MTPLQRYKELTERLTTRYEEEILNSDLVERDSFYPSYFRNAFPKIVRSASLEEIMSTARRHSRIYLSNHHLLSEESRFTAEFIKQIADERTVVHLEFFDKKYQCHLDDYVMGKISEEELLLKTRFKRWGFDWSLSKPILDAVLEAGAKPFATNVQIVGGRSEDLIREQKITKNISEKMKRSPDKRHIVVYGQYHMATLPQLVGERIANDEKFILLQDVEHLYWQLFSMDRKKNTALVAPDTYALFHVSPLTLNLREVSMLESGFQDKESQKDKEVYVDLVEKQFYILSKFFGVSERESDRFDYPDILTYKEFNDILNRLDVNYARNSDNVKRNLESRRSFYVSRYNLLVMNRSDRSSLGELVGYNFNMAMRNQIGKRGSEPKRNGDTPEARRDLFSLNILETMNAYICSKVLNYSRRPPFVEDISAIEDSVEEMIQTNHHTPSYEYLSRAFGYALGSRLFESYLNNNVSLEKLRALLSNKYEEVGSAYREVKRLRDDLSLSLVA